MQPRESLLQWHPRFDNPTFVGWAVVAAYIGAAICCGRAAAKSKAGSTRSFAPVWWLLASGLLFLGINKQLNLQTLMIVTGRNLSRAGRWYGTRRRAQLIFSALFAAACLGALAFVSWRFRHFFREHPLALGGAVVLALFVVLRAATINHTDQFLGINLKDEHWAWVLEIAGSALLGAAAMRGGRTSAT